MAAFARIADHYHRRRRRKTRRGAPADILLLSCGGLGDTVLFSHVVERFAALAGDGEDVTVLLRRDGAKTAFLFPEWIMTRTVDFDRLRRDRTYRRETMDDIHEANYRLVVSSDFLRHPDLDEALALAAQAPETVAMKARAWPKHQARLDANGRAFTRLFDSGPDHLDKVVRWARFADWLTGRPSPSPLARVPEGRLPPSAEKSGRLVLMQPFSAVKAKQSPPPLYRRLIAAAPEDVSFVITGTDDDLQRSPEFAGIIDDIRVSFDSSTFADLVPRLRAADTVVSVDTALAHLAIAVGAPTLCLASAAYVGEIMPYAPEITPDNAHFLYIPMECQGCLGTCKLQLVDGMFPCVAKIEADEAVRRFLDILAG